MRVLIEIDHWLICEAGYDGRNNCLWVWHQGCTELPERERGMNQQSWVSLDPRLACILCTEPLPDEIQALVTLYTKEM